MKKTEIIEFVKKIELFKGLTNTEFETLSISISEKNYSKGEFLFTEGTKRDSIFIIVDGEIELIKKTALGNEKKLTLFHKFDFLGEGSLMDDAPHSTSSRAACNSITLYLNTDFFQSNASITIKVFSNIARVISRRMRHANDRLLNSAAQYVSGRTRTEHDLLGYREVPYENYYGIQTLRATENFHISGITLNFFPIYIEALAITKMAAAKANHELGLLQTDIKNAIVQACEELMIGKYQYHFVVDMVQGGAGTSINMNANEVIANRALEIMGHEKGAYKYCHPNNHVNLSQSTNDAYPTANKIAIYNSNKKLIEVLKELITSFRTKEKEFAAVIKMGRTQLQDAVPMTLGQSFGVMAHTLSEEIANLQHNANQLLEVNMGGTAIGTGLNADPEYPSIVVKYLAEISGNKIILAKNLVEDTQDTSAYVSYSSAMKRLSVKISKICNDLRLLASGPRAGLHEINLPPMQPGSSIMPGKVNPVIPEVMNQIAYKVIGNELAVTLAAEAGQLELNVMEPIIMQCIFESVEMLKNGMNTLKHRCIDGITANVAECRNFVERSIGLVTALNPYIGYENCTQVAKEALESGKSVYDLVLEKKLLTQEKLDEILKPENMVKPHKMF